MKIIDLKPLIDAIQQRKSGFQPKIALILGSGLGVLADKITNSVAIPFSEIPHFPRSSVAGHKGQLILGTLGNTPVACMQGRIHGYEGVDPTQFKIFIRTLKLLGCEIVIITNAAGSLRPDIMPGQLTLINDHINLQHRNPLIGENNDEFGPRFFAMTDAYNAKLRKRCLEIAKMLSIPLKESVYLGVTGPCFETPAEINAFRILGADLVGMSTIPEVIIARHCDMRILAVSSVTNLAAGMADETLTHEGTLHMANVAANAMEKLMVGFLESLNHDPC